jgi:prepilin-type N-terminal cleavage/methylation domain-containing protein
MPGKCRGWTLIEILAVMVMVGLSMAYAANGLEDWLLINRRASQLNQLQSILRTARLTAMVRHQAVVLCPSRDGKSCARNWNLDKLLFEDHNRDGQRQAQEPILRRWPAIPAGDNLYWKAFRRSWQITFLETGMTDHQNGTFLYCPLGYRSDLARGLVLTKLGRIRTTRDENQDGLQDGASGRPLRCKP